MHARKIVLVSISGYSEIHDPLLLQFLEQGVELFCVCGKDCEVWEEVMDELAVGDGSNVRFVATSSHPNETREEVIEFAKVWKTEEPSEVQIVEI